MIGELWDWRRKGNPQAAHPRQAHSAGPLALAIRSRVKINWIRRHRHKLIKRNNGEIKKEGREIPHSSHDMPDADLYTKVGEKGSKAISSRSEPKQLIRTTLIGKERMKSDNAMQLVPQPLPLLVCGWDPLENFWWVGLFVGWAATPTFLLLYFIHNPYPWVFPSPCLIVFIIH